MVMTGIDIKLIATGNVMVGTKLNIYMLRIFKNSNVVPFPNLTYSVSFNNDLKYCLYIITTIFYFEYLRILLTIGLLGK